MKNCWNCAESIQDEALTCRFCQADQTGKRKPESKPQPPSGCAIFALLAFIGTAYWINQAGAPSSAPPAVASKAATAWTPTQQKSCDKLYRGYLDKGLFRSAPSSERVDVNDRLWDALDTDVKTAALSVVACHAFRTHADNLGLQQYVVAYGKQSGKRKAMLNGTGVKFE